MTSATSDRRTGEPLRQATMRSLILGGDARLVVGVDLVAPVADLERALGRVGVGRRQRCPHAFQADAGTSTALVGLISTRTAGSELPPRVTWPTPVTWLSFCCRTLEAAS
mgnify:CR=1 FL=1